jgi:SAM-dependent methyltransferase
MHNLLPDRGKIGPTPAMTHRADESFLDYIADLRGVLMMEQSAAVHRKADAALAAAGVAFAPTAEKVEAVRAVVRESVPDAGVWARTYRSTQEAFWSRVTDSYEERRGDLLALLDESDRRGPGSVTWDPAYVYPAYLSVETHRQNAGYAGDPLSGLRYDYGTRVFHGRASQDDILHKALAAKVCPPLDGRVARIMDIGCSIGQLACELKRRFPDAEVWASDISAPMVRYGHYRAAEQNLDIRFVQKAAENLDELPAESFDLVTVHILFHEVPLWVTERTIANVFRLLRPGGTFWISDFPTEGTDPEGLNYTGFLAAIDSADNSEPYAPDFVRCNIERRLEAVGFRLRYRTAADMRQHGRVCDKPFGRP